MPKGCSVTGHRKFPVDKVDYVKEELRKEVLFAVNDGYTYFISGMAESVDLYFAEIVIEIRNENPGITLEAAIPYRKWLDKKDKNFQRLIKLCDTVTVNSETYTGKGVFMTRNMYMVNNSERVIAVYDGRESGGTAFTIRHARTQGKELKIIMVKN